MHESELEFEKEMLDCRQGYYPTSEDTERKYSGKEKAIKRTNYCLTNYCRRTEPSGYNMGTSYYVNYISPEKFDNSEHNCLHGLSEPQDHDLIIQWEGDKRRRRIVMDAFISLVTEQLHFTKISSK